MLLFGAHIIGLILTVVGVRLVETYNQFIILGALFAGKLGQLLLVVCFLAAGVSFLRSERVKVVPVVIMVIYAVELIGYFIYLFVG